MERYASIKRATKETDITAVLSLDGAGNGKIASGIGFFDHMLEGFARHGFFDLTLTVKGDLHVDGHHSVEDAGIVLGKKLWGTRRVSGVTVPVFCLWMTPLRCVPWICAVALTLPLTVIFRQIRWEIWTQSWFGNSFMPFPTARG